MCISCETGIEARVQDGVKFLDEHGPEDWRSRINLETLDISSVSLCVLGQVFDDKVGTKYSTHECENDDCLSVYMDGYSYGSDLVEREGYYTSELGFAGSALLTAEWKRVLSL